LKEIVNKGPFEKEKNFEKDAVKIEVVADPMLKLDNKKAHTLFTCFYQLKAPQWI